MSIYHKDLKDVDKLNAEIAKINNRFKAMLWFAVVFLICLFTPGVPDKACASVMNCQEQNDSVFCQSNNDHN